MFNGVSLEVEDLYLLESFQISYLPGWVPEREFGVVLQAYPCVRRYLVKRYPPIADFVDQVVAQADPVVDQQELDDCIDQLVWTIADLLVYSKCPEAYDSQEFHNWDFNEIMTITSLHNKVVIEGGAGTGRVTLEAAQAAHQVFADDLGQAVRAMTTPESHPNLHPMAGYDYREYYVCHSLEELIRHSQKQHPALWPAIEAVVRAHADWGQPSEFYKFRGY